MITFHFTIFVMPEMQIKIPFLTGIYLISTAFGDVSLVR
jgi:hypothetical protein